MKVQVKWGLKWKVDAKGNWVTTGKVRKAKKRIKCPDCKLKLQNRSLKNHRGNRTCSAIKHSLKMLDKGYARIYSYVATLRRLGIEVISETDAKTCIHIGNISNTYRYGWTNQRAATISNNVRRISSFLTNRDRNRLLKQGMTDDKLFSSVKKINDLYSWNHRDNWKAKLSNLLQVSLYTKFWDRNSNRYHSVATNPDGSKTPCCTIPNTDSTALAVAGAFGFPVPLCIQRINDNE